MKKRVLTEKLELGKPSGIKVKKNTLSPKGTIHFTDKSKYRIDTLSVVSHEIRSLFTEMMGAVELIKFGTDDSHLSMDPNLKRAFSLLSVSSESLNVLLDDILDYSQIESGIFRSRNVSWNVRTFAAELETLYSSILNNSKIKFRTSIAPQVPAYLISDPARLKQMIRNLVSNSMKYTKEGLIEVSFKLLDRIELKAGRTTLLVEVKDTGIGFQAAKEIPNGHGIGLSICQQLIKSLEGEMGFDSSLSVGTLFWLKIPVIQTKESVIKTVKNNDQPSLRQKKVKVLLVEDSLEIGFVLTEYLNRLGCSVSVSTHPEKAIELFRERPYDILLADEKLDAPISGLELIKLLKSEKRNQFIEKRSRKPKYAIVTAEGSNELKEKMKKVGIDGFLLKPFDYNSFANFVSHLISK